MGQLDFALIGNCQVLAVVDPHATIVWGCLPHPDSPALFASLVSDRDAGYWSISPVSELDSCRQHYVDRTNVVRTLFEMKDGSAFEVLDYAPRYPIRSGVYHRPSEIHRVIRPIRGKVRVRTQFEPRFEYGKTQVLPEPCPFGVQFSHGGALSVLQSTVPPEKWGEWELEGPALFVLGHGEVSAVGVEERCGDDLEKTIAFWRHWVKHCRIPLQYQDQVIRSALALKLHVFEPTGAILAASTTSIPESPDGGRNWDYRYCWLRDAYFVIHAFGLLERVTEIEQYVGFLKGLTSLSPGEGLQPVYGIHGEKKLTEIILPWLKGFKGYGPVRVGNAAWTHHQYDVYGEWVLSLAPVFVDQRMDPKLSSELFAQVAWGVEKAIEVFGFPDAGLWEIRGEESHFVFSKVMLWAAVDRGLRIAQGLGREKEFPHWSTARDRMRREIETRGWNAEKKYYSAVWDGSTADASNLLMGALGFHPHSHPRFHQMLEGYRSELLEDGYVFRYRHADDFGVPRHAFTICSYWYVDFLIGLGRREEAREMFERLLGTANHVGLLSEDLNQHTGELWGNFPQTYSHVGVIQTAFRLSEPMTSPELNA